MNSRTRTNIVIMYDPADWKIPLDKQVTADQPALFTRANLERINA